VSIGFRPIDQVELGGIDYTGHLTRLMADIVARVPALSFIDLTKVLVFARPGRTGADGAYASCHSLCVPDSEPGYFFWRDRDSGRITRRTEWFVTRSPHVRVGGSDLQYLVSFAVPRFCDQSLARSRKAALYPADTPAWVAKLDTVVHELYHMDPNGMGLRVFERPDGTPSPSVHGVRFFEDVAEMVKAYLDTRPDPELFEFLQYDFDGLTARYGGVTGVTFRQFPSYPRRYRELVQPQPAPPELGDILIQPLNDSALTRFSESDLQIRAFHATTTRPIHVVAAAAA
jgi:hypothetical protein